MESIKKYKWILITIVVVILLFVGYNFFVQSDEPEGALTSEEVAPPGEASAEILVLLNTLKGIELDTSLFDNPLFKGLIDFSVEIAPQPVGRSNPFAPIGIGNIITTTEEE